MTKASEQIADKGQQIRGPFAWVNRPLHVEWSCANLAWLLVAIGVILRFWEYLEFRTLYMDEYCLLKNIVGRPLFGFQQVLEDDQMAPPGFLVIERLLVHLPLQTTQAGRLFPLVCGIASVFLTCSVAKRFLDPRAVPLAVGMVAFGDHLLYYSAEIKQYSCDLMLALLALLLAAPRPPARMSPRRFLALGVFGLIAPWFSFPVVFVLAGVGLHLILTEATRKDYRRVGIAVSMSLLWLLSFGGLLLAFTLDSEQAGFHLGLVELRLLATAAAIHGRRLARRRGDGKCLHQSGERAHALVVALYGPSGFGTGSYRLCVPGPPLARRTVPLDFPSGPGPGGFRASINTRFTDGSCSTWFRPTCCSWPRGSRQSAARRAG